MLFLEHRAKRAHFRKPESRASRFEGTALKGTVQQQRELAMPVRDPGPGGCGRGERPDDIARHGNYVAREVDLDHLLLLHMRLMTASSQG